MGGYETMEDHFVVEPESDFIDEIDESGSLISSGYHPETPSNMLVIPSEHPSANFST